MDSAATFQQLGIALGLGLLIGLQRERAESRLAGCGPSRSSPSLGRSPQRSRNRSEVGSWPQALSCWPA